MASALKARLFEDMKTAMKAHDAMTLGTIRFLISELKNYEIDHGEQDDAGVQQVISRELKKMKEAVVEFAKGNRQDLVDQEEPKIKVVESYLPKQISDDELQKLVAEVIAATPNPNFGMVMKAVIAKSSGQADGKRVAELVKAQLPKA